MDEVVTAASRALDLGAAAVLGVGIDVEEVDRWHRPDLSLTALFDAEELAHAGSGGDRAERLAGMWCAREAGFKAVSAFATISLRDIGVRHAPDGAPRLRLASPWAHLEGRLLVSISHTPRHAAAVAVLLADRESLGKDLT